MNNSGAFPANEKQALAMLYCEKHTNESTSPAELYEMYKNAYEEILNAVLNVSDSHPTDSSQ